MASWVEKYPRCYDARNVKTVNYFNASDFDRVMALHP